MTVSVNTKNDTHNLNSLSTTCTLAPSTTGQEVSTLAPEEALLFKSFFNRFNSQEKSAINTLLTAKLEPDKAAAVIQEFLDRNWRPADVASDTTASKVVNTAATSFASNPACPTLLDSGAEGNLARSAHGLVEVRPVANTDTPYVNANGERLPVTHVGKAPELPPGANEVSVDPTLEYNLISMGLLENSGAVRIVDSSNPRIQRWVDRGGKVILTTHLHPKRNLYQVKFTDPTADSEFRSVAKTTKLWTSVEQPLIRQLVLLMHCALGHASLESMVRVVERKLIDGLPAELTAKAIRKHFPTTCIPCLQGGAKQEAATHVTRKTVPTRQQRRERRAVRASEAADKSVTATDVSIKGELPVTESSHAPEQGEPAVADLPATVSDQGEPAVTAPHPSSQGERRLTRAAARLAVASNVSDEKEKAKDRVSAAATKSVKRAKAKQAKKSNAAARKATVKDKEASDVAALDEAIEWSRTSRLQHQALETEKKSETVTDVSKDTLHVDVSMVAGRDGFDKASDGTTAIALFRSSRIGMIHMACLAVLEDLENVIAEVLELYEFKHKPVMTMRIDNQFATVAVLRTLRTFDCRPEACAPHEHWQNGVAENTVQLVDRTARTLLHSASPDYPRSRWPQAYKSAVQSLNMRLTSPSDPTISCWQAWHGLKPNLKELPLLPFGCKVQGLEYATDLAKLDSRVHAGFFELASEIHSQVVQIYDPESGCTKLRRSFWVTDHPLNRQLGERAELVIDLSGEQIPSPPVQSNVAANSRRNRQMALRKEKKLQAEKGTTCFFCKARWTTRTEKTSTAWYGCEFDGCGIWSCAACFDKGYLTEHERAHAVQGDATTLELRTTDAKTRKPTRRSIRRAKLANSVTQLYVSVPDIKTGDIKHYRLPVASLREDAPANRPSSLIVAKTTLNPLDARPLGDPAPPTDTASPALQEPAIKEFLAHYIKDPKGYKQMQKHPHAQEFVQAANEELDGLRDYSSWQQVKRSEIPDGVRIFDSMFVFKTKRDSDGRFLKFKARLTFRGDQQDDDEVGDTWAPTIHADTLRFLLALGARLDLHMSQMDITKAFLHENMPCNMSHMYMRLPVAHTGDTIYVRLLRSLYGLREAPRIFHLGLRRHLLSLGYKASAFDPCLFARKNSDGSYSWAAIHVDDILLFASSIKERDAFRAGMEKEYELTWQDEVSSFLSYTITRDRPNHVLTISQPGYARHIVDTAGLSDSSTAPSPGDHLAPYGESQGEGDPARMRNLVGLLQYLTNTRPDILCELNKVAKTMAAPTLEDVTAAERIIRYIKETLDYGITFSGKGSCQIVAFADASHQSEKGGYSRSSIVLSLGQDNGSFVSRSYTQTLLATSTQYSEIQCLSDTTRFAVYFRNISAELGIPQEPVEIFEDNNAARAFAKGEGEFDRTKHILSHYRYCVEQQSLGFIKVEPINTKLQRADQGTKILPHAEHALHTARNLNLSALLIAASSA